MFDGKFRTSVDRAVKPIGNGLRRTGLSPDHLTIIGAVVSVFAAVADRLTGTPGAPPGVAEATLPVPAPAKVTARTRK